MEYIDFFFKLLMFIYFAFLVNSRTIEGITNNNLNNLPFIRVMTGKSGPGYIKAFIGYTGPELATQEALYGFVMALIFITSAQVGLISYDSPWDIIVLIVGMNFVWGVIDMYIFYRMDVIAQRRYIEILKRADDGRGLRKEELYDAVGNTIFDALTEEDKIKAVDLLSNSRLGTKQEIKDDRKNMLFSAVTCFIITLMTTIPLILCLISINNTEEALFWTTVVACICLFVVGYKLEPSRSRKSKVVTGVTISVIAYLLTFFATYLGG